LMFIKDHQYCTLLEGEDGCANFHQYCTSFEWCDMVTSCNVRFLGWSPNPNEFFCQLQNLQAHYISTSI
jgi:hypothetical protein